MSDFECKFGPAGHLEKYHFVEGQRLSSGGRDLPLGATALKVLGIFLKNPGIILSKQRIFKGVYPHGKVDNPRFALEYVRQIRNAFKRSERYDVIKSDRPLGYKFCLKVYPCSEAFHDSNVTVLSENESPHEVELAERTYFKYRDKKVAALDTSATSRVLATRHDCDPIAIGDQVFPVTILWQNRDQLVHPDKVLGTFDGSSTEHLTSSPTLNASEYAPAREFIKSKYTMGPIKHEGLEYCMTSIDRSGPLPRIDGRFGWYYDNILTQYAMEWELKKFLKNGGDLARARHRVGVLPLREAAQSGRDPLTDGTQRCTAMTVSMLIVFERLDQGLWTIIHRRSKAVGLSADMLHVVPAGMFEARNRFDRWSVQTAVKRELLEEVYNELEQQGDGVPGFDDDHMTYKEPFQWLAPLLKDGRAELSLTGICCDLLNLRPEVCTILLVRDPGLTDVRTMRVNREYKKQGPEGTFGTPWNRIESDIRKVRVGEMVPSGVACFELGRMWLRARHGI